MSGDGGGGHTDGDGLGLASNSYTGGCFWDPFGAGPSYLSSCRSSIAVSSRAYRVAAVSFGCCYLYFGDQTQGDVGAYRGKIHHGCVH